LTGTGKSWPPRSWPIRVCADPSKIDNPGEVAGKLAAILHTDRAVLRKKTVGHKEFLLGRPADRPEQATLVQEMGVDGIFIVKEPKRFYPSGELAGHLIGFVARTPTAWKDWNSVTIGISRAPPKSSSGHGTPRESGSTPV